MRMRIIGESSDHKTRTGACDQAYPANEPPTHAMVAGVNAGAFPALVLPRAPDGGVGEGLFRMAR